MALGIKDFRLRGFVLFMVGEAFSARFCSGQNLTWLVLSWACLRLLLCLNYLVFFYPCPRSFSSFPSLTYLLCPGRFPFPIVRRAPIPSFALTVKYS